MSINPVFLQHGWGLGVSQGQGLVRNLKRHLLFRLSADQDISNTGSPITLGPNGVTIDENTGGWSIDSAGVITIPTTGISHISMVAQIRVDFLTASGGRIEFDVATFAGALVWGPNSATDVYPVAGTSGLAYTTSFDGTFHIAAGPTPVVSGNKLIFRLTNSSSGTVRAKVNPTTWFSLAGYNLIP